MPTPGWIIALSQASAATQALAALPVDHPHILWLLPEPAPALPGRVFHGPGGEQGCSCCQERAWLRASLDQASADAPGLVVLCDLAQAPMPLIQALGSPVSPVALRAVACQIQGEPWAQQHSLEALGHQGPQAGRLWAEVAMDWLEVADLIWSDAPQAPVWSGLNPDAACVSSLEGALEPPRFSLGALMQRPGWLRALREDPAAPGWRLFKAHRPFHPGRLRAVMDARWPGLVRARGFVWLATQMKFVMLWARAGDAWTLSPSGIWWADRPEDRRPTSGPMGERLRATWREPWGDRRQELALLIQGDAAPLLEKLQAALLDDEEMELGQIGWRYLYNPLRAMDERGLALGPWSAAPVDPPLSEAVNALHFPQERPGGDT